MGVTVVVVIAALSFWLIPVGGESGPEPEPIQLPPNTWVEHLPVDGRLVTCVFRSNYGISCDWANARPLDAGVTTQTTPESPPAS
jgi:hypothetical protein